MFSLLAASSLETLVENNLALFAMGHIGLVLILLVFFFNLGSTKPARETKERDEEAFDYATEDGSLFKSNTEGSIALNALKQPEADDEDSNALDEPIVFNSQIREEDLPHDDHETAESEPETITLEDAGADEQEAMDPVAAAMTSTEESEADTEKRKQERIAEILKASDPNKVILINRDESILDLNAAAQELFHYRKADIEGKKIDAIIFLEDQEGSASDSEGEGHQKAKGHRKDGTHFPVQVELEMADREFGIITVSLYPDESDASVTPVPKAVETPGKTAERPANAAGEVPAQTLKLAKESEGEVQGPPPRSKPLPPPPRPKSKGNSLALQSGGIMEPGARQLDSKTIEMFSSQLSQPLQSIAQLAQLISSDEKAIPHLKKYAVAIQAKSNRMMSQIEEMSMLVSAQTSDVKMREQPFNLGNLLTSLVDLASNVGGEGGSRIQFDRGENDLIVMSDAEYFEKVLSNLISITLNNAENQDIQLQVRSEVTQESNDPAKTVNFNGQQLEINTLRRLTICTRFPGDAHTNRFFDASINRPESPLVQKLQSSSSLKNHMASIRLMKELARNLHGKLHFTSTEQQTGEMQLVVELPCVEVAAYPA